MTDVSQNRCSAITARTWNITVGPGSSEQNSRRIEVDVEFDINKSTLIVIDPWDEHPNEGWFQRCSKNMPSLVRLINAFREVKINIYYDSTGIPVNSDIMIGAGCNDIFIEWDQLGRGADILNNMLAKHGIDVIFWSGHAANICLMNKPCGFRNIVPKNWHRKHFMVRDATIAFESNDTIVSESLLDAACYEVEYYPNGYTCTIDSVIRALK